MKRNLEAIKNLVAQGKFREAVKLYETSPDPYVATALISHAYKELKDITLAISVYSTLKTSNSKPDNYVYTSLARACQSLGKPNHITSLWNDIAQQRVQLDCRLYTTLLTASMELQDTNTLWGVIRHLEMSTVTPDIILQTVLLKLFSKLGDYTKAFQLWQRIKNSASMDTQLVVNMLGLCANAKKLEQGREVHQIVVKQRLLLKSRQAGLVISAALVNMFAKCGSLNDAQAISTTKGLQNDLR